ncbi:acyltransferase ChoActase/COT/CPT [Gloeophyllum trabeum ATCC 11539]|uniref:Acyltransferase ChoActase/COT/CPT n=1 Tax=Gloeophyllum trabeum (strain ATCC 11539 / FP-39264 / Madison 617) TaxID=670483 RepID=S7Q492_GLOTA|nr:acyltransferase ChoActase/COT/CPT [Gloeophyllum trabeum ATCC 11539]EPQ54332.1 acyltransferase ChoActase/COT/CPT [Gloeophyllum trabeum ATCC 11539]
MRQVQWEAERDITTCVTATDSKGDPSRSSTPRLQRLPVPELRATVERWLKSVEPFLLEAADHGGEDFEMALRKRSEALSDSQESLSVLQDRLLDLERKSPYNWLDDNIWTNTAYLERREPIMIHSNWWLAFYDDINVPSHATNERSFPHDIGITPWQVRRAAWLVHRLVDFKRRLEKQEIYAETTRAGIWYQHAFSKVFNMCRIPRLRCDGLSAAPSSARCQIFVMIHDWFYAVEVANQEGDPVPVHDIEARLRSIVKDVQERLRKAEKAVPVGVLSAVDRDTWARNQQHLLSLSPRNQEIFTVIKDSLFALSLDAYTYELADSSEGQGRYHRPERHSGDAVERDAHLHNVRSGINARNRFFDKSLTLIVENNARAGAMGEHAPVDALVPSIACEYAIVEGIDSKFFPNPDPATDFSYSDDGVAGWNRLDWVVDGAVEQACVVAEDAAKVIIADSDDSVLWFTDYGGDWIKERLKLSPDAYIQMALQLAWYRTRHCFTAVYETALTRLFLHGRTETIRSLTTESRAFVLAMLDPSALDTDRYRALCRAVQRHVVLTREAATGKGIDRHLLGLEFVRQPSEPTPALFEDPLYELSREWKLSTSGLSAGHLFKGTGFGSPYRDGYGINYLAGPEIIKFGIESKHSCLQTSTSTFKSALVDALADMKNISVRGINSTAARL